MLGRVVVENGVKKIVPLTADCGSGNPVGTVIAVYSNKVPNGYLPCNGVAFDTAQFPVLYALLQDDHTPDLRECTLKGIGESGRTVGAHVKAGGLAVGEFVDDRIQDFRLRTTEGAGGDGDRLAMGNITGSQATPRIFTLSTNMRNGDTTEVKAVGVNFCIKATSGINENQADNVLSALSPVNAVTSGDMHAVTSNAVAGAISALDVASVGGSGKYISAISEADGKINATVANLATSIARGGTTPPTSGAVYDNLITLLNPNRFRIFTLGGDGTQTGLRITYSGSRQYSAMGFLIVSRYSIEFIHIELNDQAKFYLKKQNIIVKRDNANVTVSNTDNTITVSDGLNWNTWTILMFAPDSEIFENISFRAVN